MHTLKLIQKPSHICYKNCLIPTYNNKKLKNIPLMSSNKCFSPDSEVHLVEKRWTCNRKFQMENSGLDSPRTRWEPNKAWLLVYVFCDTWGLFLEIEGGDMSIYACFLNLFSSQQQLFWGWEDQPDSLGDRCAWSGSVSDDKLITAPVFIATVRQVPPDDDWNFPTPVEMRQRKINNTYKQHMDTYIATSGSNLQW